MGYAEFYRSIREMPSEHRPDDAIVEDDVELDRWWEAKQREIARKAGRGGGDSRFAIMPTDATVPDFGR